MVRRGIGRLLICTLADLQHSEQLSHPPLIGPCAHTIPNQDFMVPFEGFDDGLTGRLTSLMQRGRLWGETASFSPAERPGVSGDGVAARPAFKRYGRFKQTQLAFGIQLTLCGPARTAECHP